ncbi:MAG: type II toxin-antitoxin system RelE/ParE family toxin [Bdellovibrionales bacterium]|nr:type II toxin-antitoxin system RelE/ParE family toxin [Bdellovibrionales bacterium]
MLKIEITRRADKFIESLPAKQKRQITTKILELRNKPEPHDSIQVKGFSQYRRTSVGEYRIIYQVQDNILLVIVLVGRRNDDDVYKQLKRL